MKFALHTPRNGMVLLTGIFSLVLALPAWSQDAEPEKAQVLLDKVKKSDADRQVAAKRTEIERLKEDQEKTTHDTSALQQSIDSTALLVTESNDNLAKYTADMKRLEHEIKVNEARIVAERQKIEGLRLLGAAQSKSLAALNSRMAAGEAKTNVRTAELSLISDGKLIPGEGREEKTDAELARLRKIYSTAEAKTQGDERQARDAMKIATAKMAAADASTAHAKKLADADPNAAPAPVEKPTRPKAASNGGGETVRRALPVEQPKTTGQAPQSKPAASTTKVTATPSPRNIPPIASPR